MKTQNNNYKSAVIKAHSKNACQIEYPIKIISKDSEFFPKNLCVLPDCPEVLFVLGNEKILNTFSLSIVGTRNSSKFGNEIAFDLAKNLADNNITIVSGMASGIDTMAHLGTLSSNSLKSSSSTIAIVACGFMHFTSKNISLVEKIIRNNGVIISEYFPDTPPQKFTYLKRNRLVAAISNALIVIEAPMQSGALNTAQNAFKLNKPVFSIPWNINVSRGAGCNYLIENNAHILTNYKQILYSFNFTDKKYSIDNDNSLSDTISLNKNVNNCNSNISKDFIKLYTYILKNMPVSKTSIYSAFSTESIALINSKLTLMELQNLIELERK